MSIFALSCSVFYAKFYINVGIQILHNQIESCQALLPVNQFISIIHVFHNNRLETILLTIRNFVDIFKKIFNFIFSPTIASLICLYCEFTSYFAYDFFFSIHYFSYYIFFFFRLNQLYCRLA